MNELDILFEDNHLIVVIKPAGVLSQADITGAPDMLSLIKAYLKEKYQKPGDVYLGLLHRLDRPVSGVMVFAKTSKCASRISAQIREGKMTKMYRAIVCGEVSPEEGTLHGYLLKNDRDNIVKVFLPGDRSIPAEAKQSSLAYRVLSRVSSSGTGNGVLTLLEIDLQPEISSNQSTVGKSRLPDTGRPEIRIEAIRILWRHLPGSLSPRI